MIRLKLWVTALMCLIATPAVAQIQVLGEVTYPANGHIYWLTSEATWQASEDFAVSQGGHLFTVNDVDEMNFVVSGLMGSRPSGNDGDFWIGFNDVAVEGTFVWSSGEPVTYVNWSGGEPNNCCGGENFGEIWNLEGDRTWNDESPAGGGNFGVIEILPLPPPGHLQVDLATGHARFVSDLSTSFDIKSYEISSVDNELAPQAWMSSNLSARGVDAVNPNQLGQHWDAINAGTDQLLESYLFGQSSLAPGGSLMIGQIMQPGMPEPDLLVSMATDLEPENPEGGDRTFFDVPVEFVSFTPAGDFDGDGDVDGGDFLVWQRTLGSTTNLAADGSNNGVVDAADLAIWREEFGLAVSAVPASAAVPEPHGLLLATCAMFCWPLRRRPHE